jgi:hypothetical protein
MKSILRSITLLGLVILCGCATQVGNVAFPQASANFAPKRTYEVEYGKLWDSTLNALEKNRVTVVSANKEAGIIQTDYVEGESSLYALGLVASQSTRYKFNLTLRKQSEGSIKLNIVSKIESTVQGSGATSQWTDVSGQNTALAAKLEAWLYEEIEKGL